MPSTNLSRKSTLSLLHNSERRMEAMLTKQDKAWMWRDDEVIKLQNNIMGEYIYILKECTK